jgi:carbon storage regulator
MRKELAIAAKTNEASLLPSISSIHSLQEILEQQRKEVQE